MGPIRKLTASNPGAVTGQRGEQLRRLLEDRDLAPTPAARRPPATGPRRPPRRRRWCWRRRTAAPPRRRRTERVEQAEGVGAEVVERIGQVVGRRCKVHDAGDRVPLADIEERRLVRGVQRLDDDAAAALVGEEIGQPRRGRARRRTRRRTARGTHRGSPPRACGTPGSGAPGRGSRPRRPTARDRRPRDPVGRSTPGHGRRTPGNAGCAATPSGRRPPRPAPRHRWRPEIDSNAGRAAGPRPRQGIRLRTALSTNRSGSPPDPATKDWSRSSAARGVAAEPRRSVTRSVSGHSSVAATSWSTSSSAGTPARPPSTPGAAAPRRPSAP